MFNPDSVLKELNGTLRKLFSGKIKGSFLIDMMYKVIGMLGPNSAKYYDFQNINHETIISDACELPFYDICRHIVGLHRSNLVFTTEAERLQMERSAEYKNHLANQVIENIKLREYGSAYFRKHSIIKGEDFIFYPLPYDLFVIGMKMRELLSTIDKSNVIYNILESIANKGVAALSLLGDNFLDNAYPVCRVVIELYLKLLLLLMSNDKTMIDYCEFIRYDLERTCGTHYPKEFNKRFENRNNKTSPNKINYLHYGWVDSIDDYNIAGIHTYTVTGILTYLKSKVDNPELFDYLAMFYKICNGYSHGTTPISKYPLLHYFEISLILSYTVANSYSVLCEMLNSETKINDIDIIEKVTTDLQLLRSQYGKRSTEKFEEYYNLNKI